jgi:hypothetical protein
MRLLLSDNGYLSAQSIGKTPALCDPASPFRDYYNGCQACIAANSADLKQITQNYLEPQFKQFIDYCNAVPAAPQSTSVDSASLVSKWSSIGKTASTGGDIVLPTDYFTLTVETTSVVTTFADGQVSVVPLAQTHTIANTKFQEPGALSTTNLATSLSTTSAASTPSTSGTASTTSAAGTASVTGTASVASTASTTANAEKSTTPTIGPGATTEDNWTSKAWIIGPIVGAVVAICIVILYGLFVLHRIRRGIAAAMVISKGEDGLGKAQLHSNCMPRVSPQEMYAGENEHSEMSANEVPAIEVPAGRRNELGGS